MRNVIDPSRDLGHVDRALAQKSEAKSAGRPETGDEGTGGDIGGADQGSVAACEDCK